MRMSSDIKRAGKIMDWFADDTGISRRDRRGRRYLWTDAYAVCNFLELYLETGAARYFQLAADLVDLVHEILGQHRSDDVRKGWISSLAVDEGRAYPTVGGLRIGKALNERRPGEALDEHLEWERDGQYYHYLTKWAHALCQIGAVSGDPIYGRWAIDLARTMHRSFCHTAKAGGKKRLYWKMSIDLTRPLVDTMGHHDPLDGLITFNEICQHQSAGVNCGLDEEVRDLGDLCRQQTWATGDLLGIGGLLFDACRLMQMGPAVVGARFEELLDGVLVAAVSGLHYVMTRGQLGALAEQRLAFRELGLSIGLHAVPRMDVLLQEAPKLYADTAVPDLLDQLKAVQDTATRIETFWLNPANRQAGSWQGHEDINMVMLASSLLPGGFLDFHPRSNDHDKQLTAMPH